MNDQREGSLTCLLDYCPFTLNKFKPHDPECFVLLDGADCISASR